MERAFVLIFPLLKEHIHLLLEFIWENQHTNIPIATIGVETEGTEMITTVVLATGVLHRLTIVVVAEEDVTLDLEVILLVAIKHSIFLDALRLISVFS